MSKLAFDIGANRGDWTIAALNQGYKVVALEPAEIYYELVNLGGSNQVIPIKLAVSDKRERVTFYEAEEDGLSTLNKEWLTGDNMPYKGKPFREIEVMTITIDELVKMYGEPDLIKIDIEGAEWGAFRGMSKAYGTLAFEWTLETVEEHEEQIEFLKELGYKTVGYQFIEHHAIPAPESDLTLSQWIEANKESWVNGGWRKSNLRPTADVGMVWLYQ